MPEWLRLLFAWLCCLFGVEQRKRKKYGGRRCPLKPGIRVQRKPEWVVEEVIRLKAHLPQAGSRRLADTFNRCHAVKRRMTVSKSYVAYTVRRHRYEIACRRRAIRNKPPFQHPRNALWGIDLTGKQDSFGRMHRILGVVDCGTRLLLTLECLPRVSGWTLLGHVFLAIGKFGRPDAIRTDNERIFTGRVFSTIVRLAGIRHQRTEPGCPWQNGRIERLFGTLKAKLDRWQVSGIESLRDSLAIFRFWYNRVRPHQGLSGATPFEAWHEIDPYRKAPRRVEWFEAWDGLLAGYWLRR